MSVIDHTFHDFKCPKCGSTETCKVLDRGSISGSSWQPGPKLSCFDVYWNGSGQVEPQVTKAVCKNCGTDAEHNYRY